MTYWKPTERAYKVRYKEVQTEVHHATFPCQWCDEAPSTPDQLAVIDHERYPEIGPVLQLCKPCYETAVDEINAERREVDEPTEYDEWQSFDPDC